MELSYPPRSLMSLSGIALSNASSSIQCTNVQKYMRLCTAIQYGGARALQRLWRKAHFHNDLDVPVDNPTLLYKRLKLIGNPNGRQAKCFVEKLLNKDEIKYVFPENGKTYFEKWDVSLSIKLLSKVTKYGLTGTANLEPLDMDGEIPTGRQGFSPTDFVYYLRRCRNFIIHYPPVSLTDEHFEHYWSMLVWILEGLGYEGEHIADLKTGNLQTDIESKSKISLEIASSTNIRILKSRMQRELSMEKDLPASFDTYQSESVELKSLQEQLWNKNPERAIELMTQQKMQLHEEICRQQSMSNLN